MIAGCASGTTLVKLDTVEDLDAYTARWCQQEAGGAATLALETFVDDYQLAMEDSYRAILRVVPEAAKALKETLEGDMGAQVAPEKRLSGCQQQKAWQGLAGSTGELALPVG